MKSLHRVCVIAAATAALGVAVVPVASADPVRTVDYISDDGAWPMQGSAHYASPGDEIATWQRDGRLTIDVDAGFDYLRVELSAPAGESLHTGTYTGARYRDQYAPQLSTPGFSAITAGFGCGDDYADFTIDRLDATGVDLTFVQRCGSPDGPATRGEVHITA